MNCTSYPKVCIFFCSQFPVIREKRIRIREAITKPYAFQANSIRYINLVIIVLICCIIRCYFGFNYTADLCIELFDNKTNNRIRNITHHKLPLIPLYFLFFFFVLLLALILPFDILYNRLVKLREFMNYRHRTVNDVTAGILNLWGIYLQIIFTAHEKTSM